MVLTQYSSQFLTKHEGYIYPYIYMDVITFLIRQSEKDTNNPHLRFTFCVFSYLKYP